MIKTFKLSAGKLSLNALREFYYHDLQLQLDSKDYENLAAPIELIHTLLNQGKAIYGVNTGFGMLANTRISVDQLRTLQRNLLLSHATGVGELLNDKIVKLILLLKINCLAQGYSGIRPELIHALIQLLNNKIYPCIPAKGSVGASGDLAPLAHLSCVLLGEGEVRINGHITSATEGLTHAGLKPLELDPKEGLALLNGTQVSTALALAALFETENLLVTALVTGSLAIEAAAGSKAPFDARIHEVRGYPEQQAVAAIYRSLLTKNKTEENITPTQRVQDPYSLRCQPQVMGACLRQMHFVAETLTIEANAVTDNPLIFTQQKEILSGGNFHAEPIAMAADNLALSIAEIGALAERRIALLIDPKMSGLPAFLVKENGLNSGFMLAQVTAAALASENKSLAHPACVDSIPTSANQEDHVSMATFAAYRLFDMIDNTRGILAIELLATCQGVELRTPYQTSAILQNVIQLVRQHLEHYTQDRYFAPDIEIAKKLIWENSFIQFIPKELLANVRL
jgi:histidine ammonia-lyase